MTLRFNLQHGTCPTCRHSFLDIKPLTESDFESDDDDYIPEDEDEEEDDAFMDTEDDWDFDADGDMDTDVRGDLDIADEEEVDADLWEDHDDDMDNMGLSDGYGSESYSEGDLTVSVEGESYLIDGKWSFVGLSFISLTDFSFRSSSFYQRGRKRCPRREHKCQPKNWRPQTLTLFLIFMDTCRTDHTCISIGFCLHTYANCNSLYTISSKPGARSLQQCCGCLASIPQ